MTIAERIANNIGIITEPNEEAVADFRDFINPAMKDIAWQAWNERAKTALGELYNEHAQGHLFDKWYNKEINY